MIKLRKPSEVILSNGKTLEEVLKLHKKWLNDEKGGERAKLSRENLMYADLSYSDLSYADLSYADLSYTDLRKSDLKYTNLENTNLSYVNLMYTDLSHSNLSYVNLRKSDLNYSYLINTNLKYTDLTYSNLSFSNLNNANLKYTKFYLTNLYKAKGSFVSVGNIGSRNDATHYFYKINRVICGCFNGTMEEFEDKVKETYTNDTKEYKQYIIAIRTLKELAEIN